MRTIGGTRWVGRVGSVTKTAQVELGSRGVLAPAQQLLTDGGGEVHPRVPAHTVAELLARAAVHLRVTAQVEIANDTKSHQSTLRC
jgi:hypothetical protein